VQKILILKNIYNPRSHEFADELSAYLKALGKEVMIHNSVVGLVLPEADLVIVLGGDGSVLHAAHGLKSPQTPIFPINFGSLGYMANFSEDSWHDPLMDVIQGKGECYYSPRMCLKILVERKGKIINQYRALNDCVIAAQGISKMVHLKGFYKKSAVGDYRVDGLILATPTGSTAYSLSAGGSVVDPASRLILFTPICPHSLSQRPIVFSPEERVSVHVEAGQRTDLALMIDGQEVEGLQEDDWVHAEEDERMVYLVSSPRYSFYDLLAEKMMR
jgi:NAD+ kinase